MSVSDTSASVGRASALSGLLDGKRDASKLSFFPGVLRRRYEVRQGLDRTVAIPVRELGNDR
jgi:hypothetical protein